MDPHDIAWTLGAVEDATTIVGWIGRHDPDAGRRWQSAVNERIEQVAKFPYSGRRVPEFGRDDLREVIFNNYRIVYQVTAEHIVIVRVLDGHRKMPDTEL